MEAGANFFSGRISRGLAAAPRRYPTKDIFVISRGLTNVRSGLGSGHERPTIYERTLNYSTSSQYPAHFYIIVYDRAVQCARYVFDRPAQKGSERESVRRFSISLSLSLSFSLCEVTICKFKGQTTNLLFDNMQLAIRQTHSPPRFCNCKIDVDGQFDGSRT